MSLFAHDNIVKAKKFYDTLAIGRYDGNNCCVSKVFEDSILREAPIGEDKLIVYVIVIVLVLYDSSTLFEVITGAVS